MENNTNPKIHTTIGLYNNNSIKINGVIEENLKDHIQYNLNFRPGRAFFVDGKCIHKGYIDAERIKQHEEKFKNSEFIIHKDTQPYVKNN